MDLHHAEIYDNIIGCEKLAHEIWCELDIWSSMDCELGYVF